MSAEKELLKQLKIKTGACVRLVKDTVQSTKEIASQNERIERVRADPEKDDHDVRKQQEVLQEYVDGQKDEFNRLKKAWEALTEQIGICEEEPAGKSVMETEEWTKAKDAVEKAEAVLEKEDMLDD